MLNAVLIQNQKYIWCDNMREIKIEICKPQDGGKPYNTLIKSDLFYRTGTANATIYPDRSGEEQILKGSL